MPTDRMPSRKEVQLPRGYERRYTRQGQRSHIVDTLLPNTEWREALCGQEPVWPSPWYGTGNQGEIERAASLRPCRVCAEMLPATAASIVPN